MTHDVRALYATYQWKKRARLFLLKHPICAFCDRRGIITPAQVVDHIVPHKGNLALFWKEANWQPLCKACHDSTKKAQEHGRNIMGAGVDGQPVDPNHPWHTAGSVPRGTETK